MCRERHAKLKWETPVPNEHKLTDTNIDDFVKSMMPIAMTAVFHKKYTQDFCHALQYLAIIRPSLVIPSVLEKVYPALGAIIEPHKHIAAMNCMMSIARPLVQGSRNLNEGNLQDILIGLHVYRFMD